MLVGVSRTSKTPTSIYLANRGIKTANFPLVQGAPLPAELLDRAKAAGRRAGREPRPHRAGPPAPGARHEVRRAHRFLCRPRPRHRGDRLEPKALRPPGLAGHRRDAPLDRGDGGRGHRRCSPRGSRHDADPRLGQPRRAGRFSRMPGSPSRSCRPTLDERAAEAAAARGRRVAGGHRAGARHGEGDDGQRARIPARWSSAPTRCSSSTASG